MIGTELPCDDGSNDGCSDAREVHLVSSEEVMPVDLELVVELAVVL